MVKKIKQGPKVNINQPLIIAGPCSVENYDIMDKTVKFLKELGIEYIRGGAFKPRTSPYSFQGLGMEGIEILEDMKKKYGVKIVSEILDIRDLEEMIDSIDIIQVGSRNMYNYPLLKELGRIKKPILLKRGISATIDEWLNAAEYIALEGNTDIILCERGIRTFENYTRNTLDLNCVPVVKQRTNLAIIVDPSHGTGRRELVKPLSLAAIAAGADGLLIEVHPDPDNALSDGFQSLNFEEFKDTYNKVISTYHCVNTR
ncbi:3-deoxy-7-phosphoheptulonate synthase [Caloramator australicus]|jgi:3-deoxy-7-phosphoheptulonate synthase|uniref:2-keto-3-deoxy-D-arabino-heptulosonate-7-phosphate synthase I beta n=1 Tax=Caloramator australicus RC3 TaxID=857293 RepID=I7KU72_9CLOT|nr:3-deoxy-7-phosphoheptulonate synthase [Caloramator australicus]CCJ33393.1 2-keto-3-deoxy-D-arabino-heptulosonate-7-phosphate synthase I beta [Caloramator australicus RC3]